MKYSSSNYQILRIDPLQYANTSIDSPETVLFPIDKNFKNSKRSTLILTALWNKPNKEDQSYVDLLDRLIKKIKKKYNLIKIIILFDGAYKYLKVDRLKEASVIFIEYHIYSSYMLTYVQKRSKISPRWNHNAKKFLFLTGKPNKLNRIRLFYKLVNNDLIGHDTCVWSLFEPVSFDNTITLVPELKDNYREFFNKYVYSLDNPKITNEDPNHGIRVDGLFYDSRLFENTNFRIIAETNFDGNYEFPSISEKTWITILNSQPFIMSGDINYLKNLRKLGFRTFNNYLKIKDYDTILDPEKRLDAVVENTKYWCKNILKFKEEIQQDVEYNRSIFYKLAINVVSILEKLLKDYNIPLEVFEFAPPDRDAYKKLSGVVLIKDGDKIKIEDWYLKIKGKDWPPSCKNKQEFNELPGWVKKECIDKFGFDEDIYI